MKFTILKSGVIYGLGDHLLDHLSHALHTLPLFATVGRHQPPTPRCPSTGIPSSCSTPT